MDGKSEGLSSISRDRQVDVLSGTEEGRGNLSSVGSGPDCRENGEVVGPRVGPQAQSQFPRTISVAKDLQVSRSPRPGRYTS